MVSAICLPATWVDLPDLRPTWCLTQRRVLPQTHTGPMADDSKSDAQGRFPATRWSIVLAAGQENATGAGGAINQLCRLYWAPLYAFVRYRGIPVTVAQDLVQGFFLHLIENETVRRADQLKGSFRSFLIGCLKNFLADQRAYDKALKRGGGRELLSLDTASIEESLLRDRNPTPESEIERRVDRQWALIIMQRALDALAQQYQGDNARIFAALRPSLVMGGGGPSYEVFAAQLGMTLPAVKSAIFRFRREYRDALRREIALTVSAPHEVDAEIKHLLAAVASD